ncbi:MAG: KamA family radical SAM protein [Deltaproteobacteria bacterium]|nr:KamA family radical SAM protein [Deltaproteobacteria bacterium]
MLSPPSRPPSRNGAYLALSESVSDPRALARRFGADPDGAAAAAQSHPALVNPYFLSLIRRADDPLGRQVIPHPAEILDPGHPDPLCEERLCPAPGLIRRYPDRALWVASSACFVRCRYCMRKRLSPESAVAGDQALEAIRRDAAVREVILSGGDPLTLSDEKLEDLLARLREIPHVRVLRVHTRAPGAWPFRITPELARLLASFSPLYVNVQFNHPAELTTQATKALATLADAGIPLGSQTVLLAGVNDRTGTLAELFQGLLELRVKPYYLHHLDRVPGTAHFAVPLSRGLRIMDRLRGRISGMALPRYVVDLPGGRGKVPVTPQYLIRVEPDAWVFRGPSGRAVRVSQPRQPGAPDFTPCGKLC